MYKSYFKTAWRNLIRNKYYTSINIFGLVCGMLTALIIAKYIGGSVEFDRHHLKKDRIASVYQQESVNGNQQNPRPGTYWGVGEMALQYPGVQSMTRYWFHVGSLVIADHKTGDGERVSLVDEMIYATDSSFLHIFTFPFIYGDPATALSQLNSAVLTQTTAQRYFGDENPVGRSIKIRVPWGREKLYQITGVAADIPARSNLKFDFLINEQPLTPEEYWNFPDYSTYVLFKGHDQSAGLSTLLTNATTHLPQFEATNRKVDLSLVALGSGALSVNETLLVAIAIFITLISWINYINQIVAQSYLRTKEIGMLRVMGASKGSLALKFIFESGLVCLAALLLVVFSFLLLEPSLQSFTNGRALSLFDDPTPVNKFFLAIFITGIILSALIPAVILFSPGFGSTLGTAFRPKVGSTRLRNGLVILQFAISVILMFGVFVISDQLKYLKRQDKGLDMNNILVINAAIVKDTTREVKRETVALFKSKCATLPLVADVAISTTIPGEEYRQETYVSIDGKNEKVLVHQNGIDELYLNVYRATFLTGQNFIPDARFKNKNSIILNESAARGLGISNFKDAPGSKIIDHESGQAYDLIGVIKDFHQTSLKYPIEPMAFKYNIQRGHFSIKMNMADATKEDVDHTLVDLARIWKETYDDAAFTWFFLDEKFAAQDNEERSFGQFFTWFTALSVVISCLGLFGLSLLISTKRQREIGVRKVFGATSADILTLFLRGYAGPLLLSMSIGFPIAYFMMNKWLESFAYKTNIGFGTIVVTVLTLTVIFLITVSYHTISSSLKDPVNTLRD